MQTGSGGNGNQTGSAVESGSVEPRPGSVEPRTVRRFSLRSIAMSSLHSAGNILGDATTRIGTNIGAGVTQLKLKEALDTATSGTGSVASNLRNITTNMASNVASGFNNLTATNLQDMQNKVQGMASLENLQDGLQSVSAASMDGLQSTVAGLEGLSKSIMDNIAEKKKALTNEDVLKNKGNFQLLDTIRSIEYQLVAILLYFLLAFLINWYLVTGVTQTVTLMKSSRDFLDDPNLNQKLLEMKDSIGSDIRKYSDLHHIKEGMDGLRNSVAQKLQDGAKKLQDGAKKLQDGARVLGDNIGLSQEEEEEMKRGDL